MTENYLTYIKEIIGSLNPSEKGYLKKFLKFTGPEHFSKMEYLFELIERSAVNDQSVKISFDKKYKGISFDEYLDRLIMILLKGLENYHQSPEKEIRSLINQLEILMEKNLTRQAEKQIIKLKKLLKKSPNYELMTEACEFDLSLLSLKPPTNKNLEAFEEIFNELNSIIKKQQENTCKS